MNKAFQHSQAEIRMKRNYFPENMEIKDNAFLIHLEKIQSGCFLVYWPKKKPSNTKDIFSSIQYLAA